MVNIDRHSKKSIFYQLYQDIRQQIVDGSFLPGQKITSSRALAKNMSVSRNTVDRAYQQLMVEGYITSRPRSGYVVAKNLPGFSESTNSGIQNRYGFKDTIDFNETYDKLQFFPQQDWSKAEQKMKLQGLQHIQPENGDWDYRNQLAHFLKRTKSIEASADQIVVVSGFNEAAVIIHNLLDFERIAVANPLAPNAQKVWQQFNSKIDFFQLHDKIENWFKAPIAVLSANHTFPTGDGLDLTERKQLAEKIISTDKYLIELDTDGTFDYENSPLPSLMNLAPDNCFYYGNYDDTLGSSLCMGYLVIPNKLVANYRRLYHSSPNRISQWQQRIIANMLADGSLATYFRKLSTIYDQRRLALIDALNSTFGEKVEIIGQPRGTFVVAKFVTNREISELCQVARDNNILVVDPYLCWNDQKPTFKSVVFSFRQVEVSAIDTGISKLGTVWNL